jgi:hypothetical protein
MGTIQAPVKALSAPSGRQFPILRDEPRVLAQGIDLLRWKPLRRLALWPGFPYSFQGLMLAVLAGLAFSGWGLLTPAGVADKPGAKTNLINPAVWGLFVALREFRLSNGRARWAWRLPAVLLAGAYSWVILRWGYAF